MLAKHYNPKEPFDPNKYTQVYKDMALNVFVAGTRLLAEPPKERGELMMHLEKFRTDYRDAEQLRLKALVPEIAELFDMVQEFAGFMIDHLSGGTHGRSRSPY